MFFVWKNYGILWKKCPTERQSFLVVIATRLFRRVIFQMSGLFGCPDEHDQSLASWRVSICRVHLRWKTSKQFFLISRFQQLCICSRLSSSPENRTHASIILENIRSWKVNFCFWQWQWLSLHLSLAHLDVSPVSYCDRSISVNQTVSPFVNLSVTFSWSLIKLGHRLT